MKYLILLPLFLLFVSCESKNSYDIHDDKAIKDMSSRITSLQEDLTQLEGDLEAVGKVLKDPDIDTDLRTSLRREVHEGERWQKTIQQHIDYLKIRRKGRFQSLLKRKGNKTLKEEAEKEIEAYFQNKEINPIQKGWNDRYRTAIEL